PGPVRPGDDEKPTAPELEVDPAQHALEPVALLEALRADHTSTSARTKRKNPTEITPFIVKNAVSSRRKSPGRTSECSYASRSATAATPSQYQTLTVRPRPAATSNTTVPRWKSRAPRKVPRSPNRTGTDCRPSRRSTSTSSSA